MLPPGANIHLNGAAVNGATVTIALPLQKRRPRSVVAGDRGGNLAAQGRLHRLRAGHNLLRELLRRAGTLVDLVRSALKNSTPRVGNASEEKLFHRSVRSKAGGQNSRRVN